MCVCALRHQLNSHIKVLCLSQGLIAQISFYCNPVSFLISNLLFHHKRDISIYLSSYFYLNSHLMADHLRRKCLIMGGLVQR